MQRDAAGASPLRPCARSRRRLHRSSRRVLPLVACAKGIERGTRKFMTEVIAEGSTKAPRRSWPGPRFASDVVYGLPTAVTLAARAEDTASALAHTLGSAPSVHIIRPICAVSRSRGAAKMCSLLPPASYRAQPGVRPAAALTTRGFAGTGRGSRPRARCKTETLTALSGLGDLILTCSTPQSRNSSLGLALGEGCRRWRRSPGPPGPKASHGVGCSTT